MSAKIKAGDIVTLIVGGPTMVVAFVEKGKSGIHEYADCYYVHKVTGTGTGTTSTEWIEEKFIPVAVLKLADS
jgi:uncharacterized protein YodC (DUF2158 family)